MKQLSKLQSIVMLAGAFCMVVGAGLYVVGIQAVTPWVFAVGAVSFAVIQMQQTYAGRNITIKRLRRIMTFGDIELTENDDKIRRIHKEVYGKE